MVRLAFVLMLMFAGVADAGWKRIASGCAGGSCDAPLATVAAPAVGDLGPDLQPVAYQCGPAGCGVESFVSRAPAGPACAAAAGPACANGSCGANAKAVSAGQPMVRSERRGLFKGRGFHPFRGLFNGRMRGSCGRGGCG